MIRKQDIRDRALEWGLRDNVVEKDYVLGWLLAAVGAHPATSDAWVFKGGTSIKKCFVETYRFSEDLGFTVRANAPYDEAAIRGALEGVASLARDLSGVESRDVDLRPKPKRPNSMRRLSRR